MAVSRATYDIGVQIASQKKQTGVVSPKRFIQKLKRDKEQFRSYDEHQVRPGSTHNSKSW